MKLVINEQEKVDILRAFLMTKEELHTALIRVIYGATVSQAIESSFDAKKHSKKRRYFSGVKG